MCVGNRKVSVINYCVGLFLFLFLEQSRQNFIAKFYKVLIINFITTHIMLFRITTLVALASTLTSVVAAPPACLLACVAQVEKESDCSGLNDLNCICSTLTSDIEECLESACPNGNTDEAKAAYKDSCSGFDSPASSSSKASSSSASASASTSASSASSASSESVEESKSIEASSTEVPVVDESSTSDSTDVVVVTPVSSVEATESEESPESADESADETTVIAVPTTESPESASETQAAPSTEAPVISPEANGASYNIANAGIVAVAGLVGLALM